MGEGLVAGVRCERLPQEGWQVLVRDDVLQGGDVEPAGALEEILVRPGRVLEVQPGGQDVVPPVEEDGEGEECGVLVYPEQDNSLTFGLMTFTDLGSPSKYRRDGSADI